MGPGIRAIEGLVQVEGQYQLILGSRGEANFKISSQHRIGRLKDFPVHAHVIVQSVKPEFCQHNAVCITAFTEYRNRYQGDFIRLGALLLQRGGVFDLGQKLQIFRPVYSGRKAGPSRSGPMESGKSCFS